MLTLFGTDVNTWLLSNAAHERKGTSMNRTQNAIANIEAYNNTRAWEHNGYVYIDSMKYPRVFRREVDSLGGRDFEILMNVEECEENMDILMGCRSTGMVFGGKKTHCFVMRFKP
jgi:hypothetical protein